MRRRGKLTEAEGLLHRALTLSDLWPEEVAAETLLGTLDEYAEVMKLSDRDAAANNSLIAPVPSANTMQVCLNRCTA